MRENNVAVRKKARGINARAAASRRTGRVLKGAAGALVYIAAFMLGLFARSAFAFLNGCEGYTMDGHDLVCGLLCIVMIWAAKGTFFPARPLGRKEGRR